MGFQEETHFQISIAFKFYNITLQAHVINDQIMQPITQQKKSIVKINKYEATNFIFNIFITHDNIYPPS